MINREHFIAFTTDDFILDEEFREIVREDGLNTRLNELLEIMPDKVDEINLAVKILCGLRSKGIHQTNTRKQELWQQILQKQKRQILISNYLKIAASFLLLIGMGSSVYYFRYQKRVDQVIVLNAMPSNDAKLILANGKTVSITSKSSKLEYTPDGSGIMVNDTTGISQLVAEDVFNQIIVPYGKRSSIILSDGTKVWLNSGSNLVFPPVFNEKKREVVLEGEAYFEVAKNKEKPFYVKTDRFITKVYGTKFDIQSYKKDNLYNIVLVEGKVSINSNNDLQSKEKFIAPNQKASISKNATKFQIKNIENTEDYTGWVNGYLTFHNENVTDILKRVSRYYNVPIDILFSKKVEKISGKLDLKDDLDRVIDGIAFISKTKYKKQENRYVFF